MRVGIGYDVHRLKPGRKLILGGIEIPFPKGLDGHSDADVLVHALCDALLGAAGLGDIGEHFPDSDAEWKDIQSTHLLEITVEKIHASGYRIANTDATIFAQEPKLHPYKKKMAVRLSRILKTTAAQVNIKATTTEGLGGIGDGDGIAAVCVVLIV